MTEHDQPLDVTAAEPAPSAIGADLAPDDVAAEPDLAPEDASEESTAPQPIFGRPSAPARLTRWPGPSAPRRGRGRRCAGSQRARGAARSPHRGSCPGPRGRRSVPRAQAADRRHPARSGSRRAAPDSSGRAGTAVRGHGHSAGQPDQAPPQDHADLGRARQGPCRRAGRARRRGGRASPRPGAQRPAGRAVPDVRARPSGVGADRRPPGAQPHRALREPAIG